MNGEPNPILVDVDWLHQQGARVRVLDVRLLSRYVRGHIPGALHFDLDLVVRDNGHFSVASADLLHNLLEEYGITPDMTVVVYDHDNGFNAARLFWTLEYAGHTNVRLLDGGMHTWKREGYPLSLTVPNVERVTYPPIEIDHSRRVDGAWIKQYLDDEALTLIDTRTVEEFTGEHIFSMYGGHIPGALHINWQKNFYGGKYLNQAELARLYAQVPRTNQIVTYCQVGYRAAATYVALRALGYPYVALYDDSWSEWGDHDDYPLAAAAWGDAGA